MAGDRGSASTTSEPEKKIEVTLAHHLPADNPYTNKEQKPGDKLRLSFNEAQMLVNGAYVAGVDPADAQAVQDLLGAGPQAASAARASAGRTASPTPDAADEK